MYTYIHIHIYLFIHVYIYTHIYIYTMQALVKDTRACKSGDTYIYIYV